MSAPSSKNSGGGRRAWSEMRTSSAITAQLATRLEPPWDRNGVVRPVSGISLVTPPMTTKTWSAKTVAETGGHQLAEVVAADQRGAQAALDQQRVEQDDRDHAGQAELLAERRQDEVGPGDRGGLRVSPSPRPRPVRPPQRHPEQALTDLEGAVGLRWANGSSQASTRTCTWLVVR